MTSPEVVKAIQRALKARRLYGAEIDGIAGKQTRDGIKLLQAGAGREVTGALTRADLIDLGIVAPPKPKSNPITDFFTGLIVRKGVGFLRSTLKGNPMFSGYKTYATAIVLGVMAAYSLLFGDLPLVGHVDPGSALMALLGSLGLGFARVGAKTEAAKVAEK
jgi:peptidoglycan hydrolase-like protein with peptidoglycan-binding domain